jgi:hypothetical protein
VRPETLFADPLAEPAPLPSPAFPESVVPAAVFVAPPAPEGYDDEPLTEPDVPFRPRSTGNQRSNRKRAGLRTNREGTNGTQGNGRDRWSN